MKHTIAKVTPLQMFVSIFVLEFLCSNEDAYLVLLLEKMKRYFTLSYSLGRFFLTSIMA